MTEAPVLAADRRGGLQRRLPYLLLAPSVAYLLIFFASPMIQAFGLAFTSTTGEGGSGRSGRCSATTASGPPCGPP
ncbi:hypothetical protein [Pseudonocardia sp. NPDC049154]|uniref:hypothetical protein n=1 Tax=Pseudonocardia sp. NPDC049154 TaxID=3155501 RepID=UPI0034093E61